MAATTRSRKPKLAVFKFASCDGCQLSLLDCEDELLALAGRLTIASFPEASCARLKGPYDLALVEGSISTPQDAERIRQVRRQSKFLVTIGACATAGGIQALRNFAEVEEYARQVYPQPHYIRALARSTPVADHVAVDFELRGCPVSKSRLLEAIGIFLEGGRPAAPGYTVCLECKLRGNLCLAVAGGTPCLGPVTQAGCEALCPAYGRGCVGCFGPAADPNLAALTGGRPAGERPAFRRALRTMNAWSPPFKAASEKL